MNIKHVTSVLTRPRILAPTVFLAVGTGKTLLDYEKAKPQRKKRIMAKDSAILAGSLAGFLLINPFTRMLCQNPNIKKAMLKNTHYVITQSIAGVLNTFAGIAGAVCANELVHKYVLNKKYFQLPKKPDSKVESNQNKFFLESNVFKNFNYVNKTAAQTAGAVLSLPNMSHFTAPMIALTGMSVAKTDGYNNKIKRTAKELIANSLIPTFVVSAASLLVNNQKNYVKYPVLTGALAAGSYAGTKLAEQYQDKLDETIDSIDFQNINFKSAFKGKHEKNPTGV